MVSGCIGTNQQQVFVPTLSDRLVPAEDVELILDFLVQNTEVFTESRRMKHKFKNRI